MGFDDSSTYYDLLEVRPDATPEQIRAAYLRVKAAFSKDSAALYSLIDGEDTRKLLDRIEEAYLVLSNPAKRKQYDVHHGLLSNDNDFLGGRKRKVVSIEEADPDRMLVPPTTDFEPDTGPIPVQAPPQIVSEIVSPPAPPKQPLIPQDPSLEKEIATETEWRGSFLRRVREGRRLSIEELSSTSKISKNYIQALEDENFAKLPAAVFVRGFITQLARALKLPADKIVPAFMARFEKGRAKEDA